MRFVSTMVRYYYAGGERVAEREATSGCETLYYLLSDQLGSTAITADPLDGDKLSELRYKAWGETRYALTSLPTDRRFTGQVEEAGIGLYYFNARWYDSTLGRWAQPDSIVPLGSQGVQAWDRYAFVNNNPLRYTDPTGHAQACADGDEGGGCGRGTNALDIADYYARMRQEEGTTTYWAGLPGHQQKLLEKGGWNEGQFTDQVSAATTPADTWHDPLTYIELAIGLRGLYKVGQSLIPLIAEYLCLDGNCGNELEFTDHTLMRMAQRGVSVDQLNQTLQVKPFDYYHEGIWKLGYYDPDTRIFVGVANGVIRTVIANVKPQYIENLKKAVP